MPIPDGDPLGGVGDTLTIAEALSISDLKVRLEITHSWVGDLVVTLHHVDDLSSATLIDRPGVPGIDELGCGHSDILCTLDDTAGEAVEDQCADTGPAIAGTLRPNEPLSTFKGESSAGTWSLSVYDESPGDTGSLVSWCLEVNATAPPFTYGPPRTVSVNTGAATEVADPTTGVTFVFPQGGHGMLTTATIISSPYQPTSGGSGFHFEFTGTEPIQFKLPQTAGAETQVYAWGTSHGCFDGPPRTQRWNTWPESSLQDADLLFDTPDDSDQSSQAAQASATAAGTPIQYHDYWVNKITPSSTSGERKQLLTDQVREDIDGWLQKLSDPLLSVARAQFNNFGPRIYDDATGGGYIGFARRRVLGISFSPRITFELANAPTRVVAHETGHLMNHLLLRAHLGDTAGDAMYLRIENLLEDNHGLGDAFVPRKTTTEEIAYLSQYLVTGSIDNIDPYNFTTVVPQYFRGTPSTVDFPSLEGFGAILLSNLMRPSATMNDWERKSAAVPAIGALWNDVAGIVAVGATNINEYRTNIQAFLDGRGQGDRLGINAERLGWSYHGKGTVYATGTRDPVAGVIVTSLVKIDGTEYTASQATTDASGQFTLPRLIPGCSMLRVAKDQHTVDYSTCNGWDRPTTDEITLSDSFITVEPPPGNPTVTVDPPSGSTFELGTGAWFTITVTPVPGTTITRIEAWRVGTEYSDYFLGQSFDSNTLTTGDNDPHPDSLNTGHYRAWVHDSRGGPSFKFDFSYTWVFQ